MLAMIPVQSPCCGVTPEAMPNPIASGSAINPTVSPAPRSARKSPRRYPRNAEIMAGLNFPMLSHQTVCVSQAQESPAARVRAANERGARKRERETGYAIAKDYGMMVNSLLQRLRRGLNYSSAFLP